MKTLAALAIAALSTGLAADRETPTESKPETPPIKFQVLQSKRIDLGDRSLFLNRVVPPVLPPVPTMNGGDAVRVDATEEEDAQQKKQEVLLLSATVYDRQVTEVRWIVGQHETKIFTNIDFNFFAGMGGFETDDTVYTLIMGLGNETREEVEASNERAKKNGSPVGSFKQIPTVDSFSKTRSEYIVADDHGKEPPEEVTSAFDALHAYYDANRQRLTEDYAKREAARIKQQQWLKEHPPVPKDTVINYWVGQGATAPVDKRNIGGVRP